MIPPEGDIFVLVESPHVDVQQLMKALASYSYDLTGM